MNSLTTKELIFISFMLFSMFFGAGNLIFPAFLGYSSGSDVWVSLGGLVITAVGLPILGVIAVGKAGSLKTPCDARTSIVCASVPNFNLPFNWTGFSNPTCGYNIVRNGHEAIFISGCKRNDDVIRLYACVFFNRVMA